MTPWWLKPCLHPKTKAHGTCVWQWVWKWWMSAGHYIIKWWWLQLGRYSLRRLDSLKGTINANFPWPTTIHPLANNKKTSELGGACCNTWHVQETVQEMPVRLTWNTGSRHGWRLRPGWWSVKIREPILSQFCRRGLWSVVIHSVSISHWKHLLFDAFGLVCGFWCFRLNWRLIEVGYVRQLASQLLVGFSGYQSD